ncbi:MAG: hypothetical protein P8M11_02440 [Planctomycetota bacterium]|nr:hypothetical protein [Planctomycetota bacterium]MDG1983402.1 hypothetical protein [Planctomycetota bacterium]
MTRTLLTPKLFLPLLAAVSLGCQSTSVPFRFTPSPLEIFVQEGPGEPLIARVLVAIPGAERVDRSQRGYPELLLRLRMENKGLSTLSLDPASCVLLGSDLARFGAPRTEHLGPLSVEAGGSEAILLRFPFPMDGDLEAPLLTGVNLQFEVDVEDRKVEASVTIERVFPVEVVPTTTFSTGIYYGV